MRIGNLALINNVFLAPMAGVTDLAFRTIAHESGAGLCYTEMISAAGLTRKQSDRYLSSSQDDKPLGVQIFGAEPEILSEAVRIVTDTGADLIDINMGCPVKKVVKSGAGAALMKNPLKVAEIAKIARKATDRPLTAKLRSGWCRDSVNVVQIAKILEDCGADGVTVHPRTASQGFQGKADWNLIRDVKKAVSIPVIASGDLWTPGDARRLFDLTECDGIMIARGSLGNPWIFEAIACYLSKGSHVNFISAPRRINVIRRHFELSLALYGENSGIRNFRKHLLWYTKGLAGGSQFRREASSKRSKEEILALVEHFFNSSKAPYTGCTG
ncbi:MAG: tRNA dihydrouridine synthase DusB [Syntrophales bacterium]|jgi:nifR3 family TIM-barrel protein|nr:tRNA dihydrouridine synthase DusB [Syntrophales bacterium]MDY0044469.1 tRNA dihydrouridine synthase DusB [Syntrophales bacterium]